MTDDIIGVILDVGKLKEGSIVIFIKRSDWKVGNSQVKRLLVTAIFQKQMFWILQVVRINVTLVLLLSFGLLTYEFEEMLLQISLLSWNPNVTSLELIRQTKMTPK